MENFAGGKCDENWSVTVFSGAVSNVLISILLYPRGLQPEEDIYSYCTDQGPDGLRAMRNVRPRGEVDMDYIRQQALAGCTGPLGEKAR